MAAVDGTQIPMTRRYRGCGQLAVTRRKRQRDGSWLTFVELVFGWRLIALVDLATLIPVAIKIVPIQEHEARTYSPSWPKLNTTWPPQPYYFWWLTAPTWTGRPLPGASARHYLGTHSQVEYGCAPHRAGLEC